MLSLLSAHHSFQKRILYSTWPAPELAAFYVPPVPVFVQPGSVSDRVPPSDRCSKQWRSALTLQTTPGALTALSDPSLCTAQPCCSLHQHGLLLRVHTADFSCCLCILTKENVHWWNRLFTSIWVTKPDQNSALMKTFLSVRYRAVGFFAVMRFSHESNLISMCQALLVRRVMMFIVLQPAEVVWLLVSFYSRLCLLTTNSICSFYIANTEMGISVWGLSKRWWECWRTKNMLCDVRRVEVRLHW